MHIFRNGYCTLHFSRVNGAQGFLKDNQRVLAALRAPVLLGSLTTQTGALHAPPPVHRSFVAPLFIPFNSLIIYLVFPERLMMC
jgi:hypothetical protein